MKKIIFEKSGNSSMVILLNSYLAGIQIHASESYTRFKAHESHFYIKKEDERLELFKVVL